MSRFFIFFLLETLLHFHGSNGIKSKLLRDIFQTKSIDAVTAFVCSTFHGYHELSLVFYDNFSQFHIVSMPQDQYFFRMKQFRHEGIIVDVTCPGVENLVSQGRDFLKFTDLNHWVFFDSTSEPSSEEISERGYQLLLMAELRPDSQVIWVKKTWNDSYTLYDIYQISRVFPLNVTKIGVYPDMEVEEMLLALESPGKRRKDLQQTPLIGGAAIVYPHEFTFMDDLRNRQFDTFTKRNYPLAMLLVEDLNINVTIKIVDSFGWDMNHTGNYDGLMGMFQRKELDLGFIGLIMLVSRLEFVDFVSETIQVRVRIIFRRPPLSSLNNIFFLPFDLMVWISCLGLCLLATLIFMLQIWSDKNRGEEVEMTYGDVFTFITGAICQQGSSLNPTKLSARTIFLLVFVSALFFYTSYSANIVALLQTPSTAIKTVADLIESPLEVAAQDIAYNHVFLQESNHTFTKRLYQEKFLPRPDGGFLHPAEGMRRVQEGLFAFQVDAAFAYNYMSYNYTEGEKCDLTEIEAVRLPMQTIPTPKYSPYKDLFAQRLRWQREVGLLDRTARRWVPQKPQCESSHSGYVSVGLSEFKPAIHVIAYGAISAVAIFLVEILIYFKQSKRGKFFRRFSINKIKINNITQLY